MNLRSVQPEDAASLLQLWNCAAKFDPLTPSLLREKIWEDSDFDTQHALVVTTQSIVRSFAVAVSRTREDACTAYIKLIATHPDSARQGYATALLNSLHERFREASAAEVRVGESAPNYLTPGVDLQYAPALRLFKKNGYELAGKSCNMTVDLGRWRQTRPLTNTHAVRRATPTDARAVKDFLVQHWPSWWDEVQRALDNCPATLFVAQQGEEIVGFAAHSANNAESGWFGPMGTAPECRGQGLGAALLDSCLADMANKFATAIIPWVGPVDFYANHAGAEISREFHRFRKHL